MKFSQQRKSLLSSNARVQVPWIKVTFGDEKNGYTFGVFDRVARQSYGENTKEFGIRFPEYVKSLQITKINGQVNQYVLGIDYPITQNDDPNFFEKVFSSISGSRKITLSYGDCSQPVTLYKEEEALVTSITQTFALEQSKITYTINAVSSSALKTFGNSKISGQKARPSDVILDLMMDKTTGLQDVFTGMPKSKEELKKFIACDDKPVEITAKAQTSALDLINYLVGCMIPEGTPDNTIPKEIYVLNINDATVYDTLYNNSNSLGGPYFEIKKTSYVQEHADAYEVDIGYNTSTIVRQLQIQNNENYALYYDYQEQLNQKQYIRRIRADGEWEEVYSPAVMSRNDVNETRPNDITWWTKVTQYPISATITIQGLLRPATLMSYLRLNIIFPGGHKHIYSGLYIVTKQVDTVNESGYTTQLTLTKISGDNSGDGYGATV